MDINSCQRWWLRCKKKDETIAHKYLGGKWPKVMTAPDPSLIMWENLGKGKIDRCGLGSLTNVMAALLLLIGFFIVVFLLEQQK